MAVTHSDGTKQAVADVVVNRLDVGATNLSGRIVFFSSVPAVVATCPMNDPAFGNASVTGVATMNTSPAVEDTNTVGGTVANATFIDRDTNIVFECDVAASGSDINLSPIAVPAGVTLVVDSITYTAMP